MLEVLENLQRSCTTLAIEQVKVPFSAEFRSREKIKYALVLEMKFTVFLKKLLHCVTDASRSQLGTKHSLNISVSAGIAVWDLFQK
jgi:hypothetical protein